MGVISLFSKMAARMLNTLYISGSRPARAVIVVSMTRFEGSEISFLSLPKTFNTPFINKSKMAAKMAANTYLSGCFQDRIAVRIAIWVYFFQLVKDSIWRL